VSPAPLSHLARASLAEPAPHAPSPAQVDALIQNLSGSGGTFPLRPDASAAPAGEVNPAETKKAAEEVLIRDMYKVPTPSLTLSRPSLAQPRPPCDTTKRPSL